VVATTHMIERFHLFINSFVQDPITSTRALPEFDGVILMMQEEGPKFFKYSSSMNLKRVSRGIKNSFSHVNRVGDNNDF